MLLLQSRLAAVVITAALASEDVLAYTGPVSDGGSWTSGFAQAKALVAQMVRALESLHLSIVLTLPPDTDHRGEGVLPFLSVVDAPG